MASTVTWVSKTVFGNQRVWMGTTTTTDGTDEIVSGLKIIVSGQITPADVTGNAMMSNLVINSTTNGKYKLTTGVSAGVYHIMLIGR